MKIENLVQILNNRLNNFKLSKDYALMNGDLEKANLDEIEISSIVDTLYKLNLLVETEEVAAESTDKSVTDIILANSMDALNEYDITSYATDPLHERKISRILKAMGKMNNASEIDEYIGIKAINSPVTGQMVVNSAGAYNVDVRLIMAIMEQDSLFGTKGKAVRTLNPGNVGNDDSGNLRTYPSWAEGVIAVAEWLDRHRGKTIIPDKVVRKEVVPIVEEEAVAPVTEEGPVVPEVEATLPIITKILKTPTTTSEVVAPEVIVPEVEKTTTTTPEVVVPEIVVPEIVVPKVTTTTPEVVAPEVEKTTTTTPEVIVPEAEKMATSID